MPDGRVRYWQTVVPRVMRAELLQEVHAGVISGHLGQKKTLSRLRQCFYWNAWRHARMVSGVRHLQRQEGASKENESALAVVSGGGTDGTDSCRHRRTITTQGNHYICVIMDYFTR